MTEEFWANYKKKKDATQTNQMFKGVSLTLLSYLIPYWFISLSSHHLLTLLLNMLKNHLCRRLQMPSDRSR